MTRAVPSGLLYRGRRHGCPGESGCGAFVLNRCFLVAALLLAGFFVYTPVWAEDAAEEREVGLTERQVQQALRAAVLGDAEAVRDVAEERREMERAATTARSVPRPISSALAALSASVDRPLPTVREQRRTLSGYRRSQVTRNMEELLRREEPRQRFLEARADRRYARLQRTVNAALDPVMSLAQGQIFPLLSLPFDVAEYAFIGRLYLTPEQRRELYTARGAVAVDTSGSAEERAQTVLDSLGERRTRVAALQARQNAARAVEQGRDWAAVFWYERELQLQGWTGVRRSGHRELLRRFAEEREVRTASREVLEGGESFRSPEEFGVYRDIVRHLVLRDYEEGLPPFREAVAGYQRSYPGSRALPAALAAEAAVAQAEGNRPLAAVRLEQLLEGRFARGGWDARAEAILRKPEYDPLPELRQAVRTINGRWWGYILHARDPQVLERSLTAEEARMRRTTLVERARGLFLTDWLARMLFLPFQDPFPEPELPNAAVAVDPDWFVSPDGEWWGQRLGLAYRREGRYVDAAGLYDRMGDERRAARARHRAARELERRGDNAPTPELAVRAYERLVNAWPDYRRYDRVRRSLRDARREADTLAVIDREELRAWPELAGEDALDLNPDLLDGRRETGEIGREGVAVLRYGAYSYVDRRTGRRIELPLAEEQLGRVLALMEPRRRTQSVREELAKPRPRKRIPLGLEAGFLPGLDLSPSLVPLDPDEAARRLYE